MIRCAAIIALLVAAGGCATPIPPSGGPPDETPPELAEADPPAGAVDVDADYVRLTFSEYVDPSSFAQAFSISPSFDRPVEFDWSGRSVVVRFPEPLRENTTYVLTIDTQLRDVRSVALRTPIVYAFSTGPTISAGTLSGQIVAAADGTPEPGVDVLAYALTDSTVVDTLIGRPAYRTQTDEQGTFRFSYLSEQFYYVPAIRDANRNLQPDAQEPFAAPPAPALFADSIDVAYAQPWVLASVDTTAPRPLRAQSSSRSRHVLRFDEPVEFVDRDPINWALTDSSSGEAVVIRALFIRSSEPREVHVLTEELPTRRYRLVPGAVTDSSGNAAVREPVDFTPAAQEDTLRTRFVEYLPTGRPGGEVMTLPRDVEPGIRFNQPPGEEDIANAVSVTDTVGAALAFIAVTENGTDYEILTEPRLQPGEQIRIAVNASELSGADTTYARSYRRIPLEETGEIAGVMRIEQPQKDTTTAVPPVIVQVIPVEVETVVPVYETVADPSGSFIVSGLPAGTYRLRAFADADSSGAWNPGFLIPYRPAEGITWHSEPVRVRSRWETAVPDTLRIPIPRSESSPADMP